MAAMKKGKAKVTKKASSKASKKGASRRGARSKGPSQEEMMALWERAATPGEPHRRLEPLAGTFWAKTTMVMNPGEPPQVSEGTSEHRLVLGGRYLEQRFNATMMGMPFEGIGYTGYDNIQKRYFGTWIDSFGTSMFSTTGVGRPTAKAIDFEGTSIDPTGRKRKFVCKLRIKDRDRHSFEMWTNAPGGKPFRTMLIEYVRK